METIYISLALGAIGCSSGFLISFLLEFCLPLVFVNFPRKNDLAFTISVIVVIASRIILGSGLGIKFMLLIGVCCFLGYNSLFWLTKK